MKTYKVIGIMSGSSCDGLDISLCEYKLENDHWSFEIIKTHTEEYSKTWKSRLMNCRNLTGNELRELDLQFGHLIGSSVNNFLKSYSEKIDIISSHGHTVFHDVSNKYNLQIGDGHAISALTETDVVYDFRTLDIQKGGQGAPLVPMGDILLFSDYEACLNLGGIANVTINKGEIVTAFDVCPFNQLLNACAIKLGHEFDEDGKIGQQGNLIKELKKELENWGYYLKGDTSISNEQIANELLPLINLYSNTPDTLFTLYDHFSEQIANQVNKYLTKEDRILLSGGGAYNLYFIQLLEERINASVIVPGKGLIEHKEAIIFAFLGILRIRNEINCLSSITGSTSDSVCGAFIKC